RRARRDPGQPGRSAGGREDARQLRPVLLELELVVRLGVRACVWAVADEVEARQDVAVQEGRCTVDAGVEERDRDAGAVTPGERGARAVGQRVAELVRPDRVD